MAMDVPVHDWPLPYVQQLQVRSVDDIDLVVIHCTELPDLKMARVYGERVLYVDSGTGNSGHYYIDRDGRIVRFVPENRIANHTRGHNAHSVGIELVNNGRYPDWLDSRHQEMTEPYTELQMVALTGLLERLRSSLPQLKQIAGHEDLDSSEVAASDAPEQKVRRKRDPGPWFPWDRFSSIGLERLRAP